jgi:hypothetical protein
VLIPWNDGHDRAQSRYNAGEEQKCSDKLHNSSDLEQKMQVFSRHWVNLEQ